MLCLFCLAGASEILAQNKDTKKGNRKEQMLRHKAEVDAIKNDSSLTEDQKEAKLRELRQVKKKALGKKGKAKSAWNKGSADLKKEIDAIKNDASLTEEEKEVLIKETKQKHKDLYQKKVRKEKTDFKKETEAIKNDETLTDEEKAALLKEKRMEAKERIKGSKTNKREGNWRTDRAELKKELEAINNDPNLSDEQKAEQRKAILESKATAIREGRVKQNMSRKKYAETRGGGSYGNPKPDITSRKLTEEQKEKAFARLDKRMEFLDKELKKGRITQQKYDVAVAKVEQIRKQILNN